MPRRKKLRAQHMDSLIENVKEVDRLTAIHSQLTGSGPGRRYNVEVLHKSSIVLLVACWEAFIEDLCNASLKYMLKAGNTHRVFPEFVLNRVGSMYTGPKAWSLAGEGWKTVLGDNLQAVLAKTTGTLNTPKTAQVDELFVKTIGLKNMSNAWKWKGQSVSGAKSKLDALITLRGSIAHRVKYQSAIHLHDVTTSREFISRLCVRSHNQVTRFMHRRLGKAPWEKYWFGETS